jgi:hypothetical protein
MTCDDQFRGSPSPKQGAMAQGRPKVMRHRSGEPVVLLDESDGALHFHKLHIVPTTPRRGPLAWLEEERCNIFSALAGIHGADAVAGLFANFDDALAALKQERS